MRYIVSFLVITICHSIAFGQNSYFQDDFLNNEKNWGLDGGDDYSMAIQNGHLVIQTGNVSVQAAQNVALNKDMDFAVSARMIFLSGADDELMGIRVLMSEDLQKYYSFVYDNKGNFLISHYDEKSKILVDSRSPSVKPYDYNVLRVQKAGKYYRFFINDIQVLETTIKDFYGPMIGVKSGPKIKMQVDKIAVYNWREVNKISSNALEVLFKDSPPVQTQTTTTSTVVKQQDQPAPLAIEGSTEFKEFMVNFDQINFPFQFNYNSTKARDITNLPFVQEKYFKYVNSNVRENTIWAIGKVAQCPDGFVLLMISRYKINNQDNSRFFIERFDVKGNSLSNKDLGFTTKENGDFFQMLNFSITKENTAVSINTSLRYQNGNTEKNAIHFNPELCNNL